MFDGVRLTAGRTYVFTMCNFDCPDAGADYDAYLRLYGPCGVQVAFNDDTCGLLPEDRSTPRW